MSDEGFYLCTFNFFSFFTPKNVSLRVGFPLSRNTLSDTRAMARNLARRLHTGARARIYTSGMSPALNYIPKRMQTCPRRFPL